MRLGRVVKRLALLAAALAVAAAIAVWVEHARSLELPRPTGPFPIGRTVDAWEDLSFWIWYPAASAAPADDYPPTSVRVEWQQQRPALINFLTRDLAKVRGHAA